jgi:long-subunit acyl-CoA synthetase (AMP-forming)
VCLSRKEVWSHITDKAGLRVEYVDELAESPIPRKDLDDISQLHSPSKRMQSDLALLMLTSGSTGNSKIVCLTHEQIPASISGKSASLPVDNHSSFLNWVGLDHVGSLVEIHLHGMLIGVDQVHVQALDMISDPALFLGMIH